MSFFGFDTSGKGHNSAAPGFSQAHNPFAGLSRRDDDDDALEFDETYDGLGDQLDESGDAFNDDTFGGGGGASAPVGKDFDFFGQTAKVSNAIEEEHMRFNRQQPAPKTTSKATSAAAETSSYNYSTEPAYKPARTGYEKYKEEPVMDLQVDAALWGVAPKKQPPPAAPAIAPQPQPVPAPSRKILSLEEVEAAMKAQAKKSAQPAHQVQPTPLQPHVEQQVQPHISQPMPSDHSAYQFSRPEPARPSPQPQAIPAQEQPRPVSNGQHHGHGHPVTILQRPQSKQTPPVVPTTQSPPKPQQASHIQPTQILQNPNRLSADVARVGVPTPPNQLPPTQQSQPTQASHRPQGSLSHLPQGFYTQQQVPPLTEEEKVTIMEHEAKRAKRNHKIWLLSRDNGLMTPQDKNFITRIQLQQLVSATGNPNEHGTDEALAEDFYYQVHSQIQGSQRQHPSQPLNNFAQTYLFQTGSRQGGMRRQNRGPENHMQRMEQQVQRAVEAAKNRPKNKQLIIEGSLGKISFSNAKTPRPLLNLKRPENEVPRPSSAPRTQNSTGTVDMKSVLRDIEQVYDTLMMMEDHDRKMPPAPQGEEDQDRIKSFVEWRDEAAALNAKLWKELKVHEPIGATLIHPFIAFLSYSKGKKAIPRVFRHITHEQRTTILTIIVVHLDQLDVIRNAQINTGATRLNSAMREKVELFSLAVINSLFNFMNELDLDIVTGIMGLICDRINVDLVARTRIGASMLTMILSRAVILKQAGAGTDESWANWDAVYNNFFNIIEPTLPQVFPGTVNTGEDMYVWQLLAALGIGAGPEQQQRLVLAVKNRVLDTVALARTLPPDMSTQRLQNVNLFMRSIGLDVEFLQ